MADPVRIGRSRGYFGVCGRECASKLGRGVPPTGNRSNGRPDCTCTGHICGLLRSDPFCDQLSTRTTTRRPPDWWSNHCVRWDCPGCRIPHGHRSSGGFGCCRGRNLSAVPHTSESCDQGRIGGQTWTGNLRHWNDRVSRIPCRTRLCWLPGRHVRTSRGNDRRCRPLPRLRNPVHTSPPSLDTTNQPHDHDDKLVAQIVEGNRRGFGLRAPLSCLLDIPLSARDMALMRRVLVRKQTDLSRWFQRGDRTECAQSRRKGRRRRRSAERTPEQSRLKPKLGSRPWRRPPQSRTRQHVPPSTEP